MSEKIAIAIKENIALLENIDKGLSNFTVNNNDEKCILLIAYLKIASSHLLAITNLIENENYNSAFSLMRSLFESAVRGIYIAHCASNTDIKKLFGNNDKYVFPQYFETMAKRIDLKLGENTFTTIKKRLWNMMNDYTHAGINQIARNINEDTEEIALSYSEDEILASLSISNSILSLFINLSCQIFINGNYGITHENCKEIFSSN